MDPSVSLGNLDSLGCFLPEAALAVLALAAFTADLIPALRRRGFVAWLTLIGLLGALLLVFASHRNAAGAWEDGGRPVSLLLFHGMVAYDGFAAFLKGLFLVAGVFGVLMAFPAVSRGEVGEGEFHGLLVTCVLGMCLLATATNLLMIYLSLELVSVPSYILAGFLRHHRRSSEASLKYVIYGAFASGTMVYGMSLLYGLTGQVGLAELGPAVRAASAAGGVAAPTLAAVSLMILAGFAYKIAAVPFHFWCPDVYEGAPTPVTAFFSVGPKAAGFAALIRFFHGVFAAGGTAFEAFPWQAVMLVVCVVTMTVGNLAALAQQNLKRLFAYSSVAHAGYLLMGVVLADRVGAQAVLFYLVVYLFMNLGAFMVVITLEERFGITDVAGCRGFGWRHGFLGVAMTIFLFSLTGIPPVAGFVGKVMLFQAVVREAAGRPVPGAWYALAVIGVLNSVVSLFYYARIFKAMYLEGRPEDVTRVRIPAYYLVVVWLCLLPTLALGVKFDPLVEVTERATRCLGR